MEATADFVVESPDVVYGPDAIEAQYEYRTTCVSREGSVLKVYPTSTRFTFRTARQVPRLGVMLVGWGGNNGSTLTAAVLANRLRLSWPTRTGRKLEQIRRDIRDFRSSAGLDKVIVLWTANTERFCEVVPGLNDTAENLLRTIQLGLEVSPSTLFAVASILEGCAFLNGSPQNTLVPGALELARQRRVFVGGDDFKSGQTKVKSVLVDFLIGSGLKVVIKYVPYVGDSKRALDEYTSELMLGGTNTLVLHNTCEDSLLAAPIMLDLVLLTELCQRVSFCTDADPEPQGFHSVLSLLSFLFKAPLVPPGSPVVNALFRQRSCIENILRACVGLPPQNHMLLEHKMERPGLKRVGPVVVTCPVPCKKGPAPTAPNGCTGDANGHSQAEAPQMPTT